MKKLHCLFQLSLVLPLFLFSCKKEKDNVIPPVNNPQPSYTSMQQVFSELESQPKIVVINAGNDASFYGNGGIRYMIQANSLVKMDGTPVTGNVQVEVTDYVENGDMIFSQMLPVSNGVPLLSAGELNIRATQDGQELRLKGDMTFTALIPQAGNELLGMQVFHGEPAHEAEENKVNWKMADTVWKKDSAQVPVPPNNRVFFPPQGGWPDTLGIISDSLTMCNADMFDPMPDYQAFTITVKVTGASLGTEKVYCYTVYDEYKGMWPTSQFMGYSNGTFHENHVPDIPVHFVVFTLINGEFYGGTLKATPEDGKDYVVNISKTDPKEFKKKLNAL